MPTSRRRPGDIEVAQERFRGPPVSGHQRQNHRGQFLRKCKGSSGAWLLKIGSRVKDGFKLNSQDWELGFLVGNPWMFTIDKARTKKGSPIPVKPIFGAPNSKSHNHYAGLLD